MDIAYEVAVYIDEAGLGTLNSDIFVGQMPASKNGTYVIRSAGSMNNYLPVETTVLDIYVKHAESRQAITNIEAVKRFLHRMHNTNTGDTYIFSMLVLGDVETVERDSEYYKIYKFSVEVKHRPLSLIS